MEHIDIQSNDIYSNALSIDLSLNKPNIIDVTSEKNRELLLKFLIQCGIVCSDYSSIDKLVIPREVLLNNIVYKNIKSFILIFKTIFSSSYLTALQNTAEIKQRWPLLNLVRQILKNYNYKLTPKRLCDGYTKDKKKRYKRVFIVEKFSVV